MATANLEFAMEERQRYRHCASRLLGMVAESGEKQNTELNSLLDELNSLAYSVQGLVDQDPGRLLCHTCTLVPLQEELLVTKVCQLIVIITHQKVTLSKATVETLLEYIIAAMRQCKPWILPESLRALGAVVYENGPKCSQFMRQLLGTNPQGLLLKLIDSTEDDLKRAAIQCIGNLCMRDEDGGVIDTEFLQTSYNTILSVLQKTKAPGADEYAHFRLLLSTLRGLQNVLAASKDVHSQQIGAILAALKAYMLYGLPGIGTSLFIPPTIYPSPLYQHDSGPSPSKPTDTAPKRLHQDTKKDTKKDPGRERDKKSTEEDKMEDEEEEFSLRPGGGGGRSGLPMLTLPKQQQHGKRPKKKGKGRQDKEKAATPKKGQDSGRYSSMGRVVDSPVLYTATDAGRDRKTQGPYDVDPSALMPAWGRVSSSESEYSDTEGGQAAKLRSAASKVRQASLTCLHSVIKNTEKKHIFGYWSTFVPDTPSGSSSSTQTFSLFTCMLKDPAPKARVGSVVVLAALVEGSRHFLAAANDSDLHRSAFTSFSYTLAATIKEIHRCLILALMAESFSTTLTQIIKCLSILVQNVPYDKLAPGLLTRIVKGIKPFFSHKDNNVRTACLTCMGAILSTSAPLPEITTLLRSPDFLNMTATRSSKNAPQSGVNAPSWRTSNEYDIPCDDDFKDTETLKVRKQEEDVDDDDVRDGEERLLVSEHHPGPVGQLPGPVGHHPGPVGQLPGSVGQHPAPVGHHLGPVVHHPGAVGQLSGPVGQLPGPVGHHPGPVGHHPGPAGHHPGPVGHLPGPVGQHPVPVGHHPGSVGQLPGPVGHYPGYLLQASGPDGNVQEPHGIYTEGLKPATSTGATYTANGTPCITQQPPLATPPTGEFETLTIHRDKEASRPGDPFAEQQGRDAVSTFQSLLESSSVSWIVKWCTDAILVKDISESSVSGSITTFARLQAPCEALPVRLEALQVLTQLVKGYFVIVRDILDHICTIVISCLGEKDPSVQLHGLKVLEELGKAMLSQLTPELESPALELDNPLTPKEVVVQWDRLLTGPLPAILQNRATGVLQSSACYCLSTIGPRCFEFLKTGKRVMCITLLLGLCNEDDYRVKAASVRALGAYVLYPCLREDVMFVADTANAILTCLEDMSINVRIRAAWSIGNLSDALIANKDAGDSTFLEEFSDLLLQKLFTAAIAGACDHDKVKSNAVRALGMLIRFARPQTLAKSSIQTVVTDAIKALLRNITMGAAIRVKVRWNACYAMANVFKNAHLSLASAPWSSDVFNALTDVVRDCRNFKVRINAALALSVPAQRRLYGDIDRFGLVWSSTIHALEVIDQVADVSELKYKDTLRDQLCQTLAHLGSLVTQDDLSPLSKLLRDRTDMLESHMGRYRETRLHSDQRVDLLSGTSAHLQDLMNVEEATAEERNCASKLLMIFAET